MPAAAAVNEGVVGAEAVEAGATSCTVEGVVVAAKEEEEVEEVVADVETAAFVGVSRDVAAEIHLALAVPVGFAHLLVVLLLPSSTSLSPLSVSSPPSPSSPPLSFWPLGCSGVSGGSPSSSSSSSSSESCFLGGCCWAGLCGPSGPVGPVCGVGSVGGSGEPSGSVGPVGDLGTVAGFGALAAGGTPSWGTLGIRAGTRLLTLRKTSSLALLRSQSSSTERGSIAAAFALGERRFAATRPLVCPLMAIEEPTSKSTIAREQKKYIWDLRWTKFTDNELWS